MAREFSVLRPARITRQDRVPLLFFLTVPLPLPGPWREIKWLQGQTNPGAFQCQTLNLPTNAQRRPLKCVQRNECLRLRYKIFYEFKLPEVFISK